MSIEVVEGILRIIREKKATMPGLSVRSVEVDINRYDSRSEQYVGWLVRVNAEQGSFGTSGYLNQSSLDEMGVSAEAVKSEIEARLEKL